VERSLSGNIFEEIERVQGAGNSNVKLEYTLLDAAAPAGLLYYRLKQTDISGKYVYSNIVSVNIKATAANVIQVYPNPATEQLNLDLTSLPTGTYTIRIISMDGREMQQHKVTNQSIPQLDVHTLATGKYMLQIQGAQLVRALSFIKR